MAIFKKLNRLHAESRKGTQPTAKARKQEESPRIIQILIAHGKHENNNSENISEEGTERENRSRQDSANKPTQNTAGATSCKDQH